MGYTQYDAVVANTAVDLVSGMADAIADGWQPFGSPVAITEGFQVLQAIVKGSDSAAGNVTSNSITDASDVGKAVLVCADAAAGRVALGAGTSNFSGSYNDLTNKPPYQQPLAAGTAPILQDGTDAQTRTWSAKIIHDEIARQIAAIP